MGWCVELGAGGVGSAVLWESAAEDWRLRTVFGRWLVARGSRWVVMMDSRKGWVLEAKSAVDQGSAAGAASRLERCTEKERSNFDATIMPYVSEAWLQDEAEIASGGVGQGGFGTASFELTGLAPREPVLVVTSEFRRKVNGHCRQVWRGVESQMHALRISSGGTGCAYVAKVSGR